jgi:hypothetical protein
MALEILHGAFVLYRGGFGAEGPKIATLAGLGIEFSRIEPVTAVLELADHRSLLKRSREKKLLKAASVPELGWLLHPAVCLGERLDVFGGNMLHPINACSRGRKKPTNLWS